MDFDGVFAAIRLGIRLGYYLTLPITLLARYVISRPIRRDPPQAEPPPRAESWARPRSKSHADPRFQKPPPLPPRDEPPPGSNQPPPLPPRRPPPEDPRRVLGVEPGASLSEIKARYRFLCHAFHPDKFPEGQRESAEEEFKKLKNAYDQLAKEAGEKGPF